MRCSGGFFRRNLMATRFVCVGTNRLVPLCGTCCNARFPALDEMVTLGIAEIRIPWPNKVFASDG